MTEKNSWIERSDTREKPAGKFQEILMSVE